MTKKKPVTVINGKFIPIPEKPEEKQPELEIPLPPPSEPPKVVPDEKQRGPIEIDMGGDDAPNLDGDEMGVPLVPGSDPPKRKRKKKSKKKTG